MTGADQDVARVETGAVAGLAEVGRDDGSWELVRAVQAGDRDAFGRLYQRYLPQIHRFVRGRVADAGLAEDMTSETFLRALRRIDTVSEQRPNLGPWLVRIARNLVFDHLKSARNRLDWVTGEVPEPRTSVAGELGVEECAQARADRAAAAATVARCLDGLTPPQRRAVERYEMPVAETAAALGITEGAAKSLRHRAVRAMREHLAEEGLTCSQDCRDAAAQTRPRRTDRAAGENTSADRDGERDTGQGRTGAEPAEAQRADEVERESEPAAVDETAVAVARAGEAVARLRAHRPAAAAAGEAERAEELTRWHADDQATDDQVAQDEEAGRGWASDRCGELEGSVR